MDRLKNWIHKKGRVWSIWFGKNRAWSVSASWFPLLFLVLLWLLAVWCHLNLFPDIIPSSLWSYFSLGSTVYLLTLAYFLLPHDHDRPVDASTRTAIALAMSAAIVFGFYTWGEWSRRTDLPTSTASNSSNVARLYDTSQTVNGCASAVPTPPNMAKHSSVPDQAVSTCVSAAPTPLNEAKSDNEDNLNLVNIFAAILGVVLAAVALIAQKSAVDAKAEAERARKDILEAHDIVFVALSSRLLAYAQTAKSEAQELSSEAYEVGDHDQGTARFLSRASVVLKNFAKYFTILSQWMLDPRLTLATDLASRAVMLKLDLGLLATTNITSDHEQRLRTEFWQPATRLIEKLLTIGLPSSATPSDAEKLMLELRDVRAKLIQL